MRSTELQRISELQTNETLPLRNHFSRFLQDGNQNQSKEEIKIKEESQFFSFQLNSTQLNSIQFNSIHSFQFIHILFHHSPTERISKISERVMAQIRQHDPHSRRLEHSHLLHLLVLHFDLRLRMQSRAQTSLHASPVPTRSFARAERCSSALSTSQTAGNTRRTRNVPTAIATLPSSRGSACTPPPPN